MTTVAGVTSCPAEKLDILILNAVSHQELVKTIMKEHLFCCHMSGRLETSGYLAFKGRRQPLQAEKQNVIRGA